MKLTENNCGKKKLSITIFLYVGEKASSISWLVVQSNQLVDFFFI